MRDRREPDDPREARPTVVLHLKEAAGRWFGVACAGPDLVATAVGPTRAATLASLQRGLPAGVAHRVDGESASEDVEETLDWLAALESGEQRSRPFSLAAEHVPQPLSNVLRVAAAIPLGYVTSYGDIAKATGVEARDVGAIMARNPLYPIVPCHRVLGADLSLVGYAGSKGPEALRAKLARLVREERGATAAREVEVAGGALKLYPVEWAIAKAQGRDTGRDAQLSLFDD